MKKNVLFFVICLFATIPLLAQEMEGFDRVTPFHEDLAAVKKSDQWAFMNPKGEIVIDFRSDMVTKGKGHIICCSKETTIDYPLFNSGRALITVKKDGITHYGYIDTKGTTVLDPIYVGATHFHEGYAIVLKVYREVLGRNEVLGKEMFRHRYREVVIDRDGNEVLYVTRPMNLLYTEKHMKKPPKITARFISSGLISVKNDDGTLDVRPIN